MIDLALTTFVLVAIGFPVTSRLTGSRTSGLVMAPACSALTCTVAAVTSLLTRTPLLPWVVVSTLALWRFRGFFNRGRLRRADGRTLLLLVGLSAWPMLTVLQAPVGWDSRAIWWFHAEWFLAGGDRAAAAIGNAAFTLSHPDYPPLAPATIAAVWSVLRTDSLSMAQNVSAVLGYAGLLANAVAVVTLLPQRRLLAAMTGAALVLVGFAFIPGAVTNGYVDVLWSAWFSAAAVWLLLHPASRDAIVVGAGCAAVAALGKNEGLVACMVLVAAVAVRHRHAVRRAWPVTLPVAGGLTWVFVARLLGAQSDFARPGSIGGLVTLDGDVVGRLPPTVSALRDFLWTDAARWTAVLVLALALSRLAPVRRRHGIGSGGWLPLVAAGLVGSFVVAYLVSRYPIEWQVATSADRLAIAPRLLLLTEVALWTGIAAAEWAPPSDDEAVA